MFGAGAAHFILTVPVFSSLICCIYFVDHLLSTSASSKFLHEFNQQAASKKIIQQNDIKWDHFIFAQTWAPSTCHVANEEKAGSCEIPRKVYRWTVHGLWPSASHGSHDPAYCPTPQRHFNLSFVKPLIPVLEIEWPNIIPGQTVYSLWKHEWEKHGSCAVSLQSLPNELAYFNTSLNLHNKYDLLKMLEASSVLPSDGKLYPTSVVKAALASVVGDESAFTLHCVKSKMDKNWYLSELRICMDTSFNLIKCPTPVASDTKEQDEIGFAALEKIPVPSPCPDGDVSLSNLQCGGQ